MVDLKYFDNELYMKSKEYIQLYMVIERLITNYNYKLDDNVLQELYEDMGKVLLDMNVCLHRLMNKNYTEVSVKPSVDRFNYKVDINSNFAYVSDMINDDFNVRVHIDDVDVIDELLNDVHINIMNLTDANHNLENKLNNISRIVDNMLMSLEDGSDEYKNLMVLQRELLW